MNATLTAVPGIKVGHHTLAERPTGCTVVIAEAGATAGVDVRGGAPATRETDLLDPVKTVERIYAIVLSGGSAFGLDSAAGVMRYLEERKIGYPYGGLHIPIVPGASLFDLRIGDPTIRPTADSGYRAARAASAEPVAEGNVGAGAGATLGHLAGPARAMKGGLGSAAFMMSGGVIVAALAAVNPLGDVIDPATNKVVAGARTADGAGLADARALLRAGVAPLSSGHAGNSTIGVVATNAALTKTQAARVAQMAHAGCARTIWPIHTPVDGDAVFTIATATIAGEPNVITIGALAADVMAEAILRAVRQATGIPGYPAARDLAT